MSARIDLSKPVRIKQEILDKRRDMKHYVGMTGWVDATGDYPSTCSVIWGDRSNGWRSWHNTTDLENA